MSASKHDPTDAEAALIIAKSLKELGYEVVNIKGIELDIKWLREMGFVKK